MEPYQFTLEEANSLVPWLAGKFTDLDRLQQEYSAIRKRITDFQITPNNKTDGTKLKSESEQVARQIEESIEEILDQGIIVRDASSGLVDFPSLRNGQDIYLCWIGGEERIQYWHGTDEGFSHRKPL